MAKGIKLESRDFQESGGDGIHYSTIEAGINKKSPGFGTGAFHIPVWGTGLYIILTNHCM